jgi:hypothetical protein
MVDGANDARIVELVCDAPRTGESFTDQEGTTVDMKKIFDGFDPDKHAAEAKERWGHTDAYKVSMTRTRAYTEADWKKLKDEQGSIYSDAVAAMKAGNAPSDPAAMDVAERHRLSIDRWFYPCSPEMHRGLADMYEADSRFQENIDRFGPGLTTFLSAAIRANAERSAKR